ncbi:MAG: glycosyltransferase family 4 protein [Thermoanaerobaculia bacterium]
MTPAGDKLRIVHVGRNSANQAGYAVRALRDLGHEAEMWEYGEPTFGFEVDRTIDISKRDPKVFWDAFLEATSRFDVFHFHARRTFFPNQWGGVPPLWDLPILRILGKKVFFTFHGSDCRIRSIHLEYNPWSYFKYSDIDADDDLTEKVLQIIRTYANEMFVVSIDYLPFVPEAHVVPRLIDLKEWPEQPPGQREVPKILHVPSHRGTKGTHFILDAVKRLHDAGLRFDFALLEGVPHDEARRAIQDADVVIDNVITGDYELVSLEAMASSRVTVANLQEAVLGAFPDAPVYNVDPPSLVDRLGALIQDRALRESLAARGRAYVAGHHDAPVIAEQLVEFYRAPVGPVPVRAFPDWASLQHRLRIERLEKTIFRLEQDLARARLRAGGAGGRPGAVSSRRGRDLLPKRLRLFVRRVRARAPAYVPQRLHPMLKRARFRLWKARQAKSSRRSEPSGR